MYVHEHTLIQYTHINVLQDTLYSSIFLFMEILDLSNKLYLNIHKTQTYKIYNKIKNM